MASKKVLHYWLFFLWGRMKELAPARFSTTMTIDTWGCRCHPRNFKCFSKNSNLLIRARKWTAGFLSTFRKGAANRTKNIKRLFSTLRNSETVRIRTYVYRAISICFHVLKRLHQFRHCVQKHPVYRYLASNEFPERKWSNSSRRGRSIGRVQSANSPGSHRRHLVSPTTIDPKCVTAKCFSPDSRANFPFAPLPFDNLRQDASSGLFDYPRLDLHGDFGNTIARESVVCNIMM